MDDEDVNQDKLEITRAMMTNAVETRSRELHPSVIEEELKTGPITHEEARQIAARYNRSHFRHYRFGAGEERARYSIPADPKRDDDIRLSAYITQNEAREKRIAELEQEVKDLEQHVCVHKTSTGGRCDDCGKKLL